MTCQDHKDLMMAYLDNELNDQQRRAFEAHLTSCPECTKEMGEFKKLKQMTDCVAFVEPEDRIWEEYWNRLYNRLGPVLRGGDCPAGLFRVRADRDHHRGPGRRGPDEGRPAGTSRRTRYTVRLGPAREGVLLEQGPVSRR
jgi:anti-sigma factor RsiW